MIIVKKGIDEIKPNQDNPRTIKDDNFHKLVKSIKEFPEMLDIRPIVVNSDMTILGGNMRWKACKEAGLKEIPVIIADGLTEAQQKEFLIKDNISGGEWDWSLLVSDWDVELLEDWGLEIVGFETDTDPDDMDDDFSVTDGEKDPFGQMTFMLADKQAELIKECISLGRKLEEYKYMETFGNENSNANGLYLIVSQWLENRKMINGKS
jgi:hypothetical protein